MQCEESVGCSRRHSCCLSGMNAKLCCCVYSSFLYTCMVNKLLFLPSSHFVWCVEYGRILSFAVNGSSTSISMANCFSFTSIIYGSHHIPGSADMDLDLIFTLIMAIGRYFVYKLPLKIDNGVRTLM